VYFWHEILNEGLARSIDSGRQLLIVLLDLHIYIQYFLRGRRAWTGTHNVAT
jgi:hypothetical protein